MFSADPLCLSCLKSVQSIWKLQNSSCCPLLTSWIPVLVELASDHTAKNTKPGITQLDSNLNPDRSTVKRKISDIWPNNANNLKQLWLPLATPQADPLLAKPYSKHLCIRYLLVLFWFSKNLNHLQPRILEINRNFSCCLVSPQQWGEWVPAGPAGAARLRSVSTAWTKHPHH